jgi:4-hydroxythreonine-4-phosphate dehydrogenase
MGTDTSDLPFVGITMGDPTGIGPEIIIKALSWKELYALCKPVVFGDQAILQREINVLQSPLILEIIKKSQNAAFSFGRINLIAVTNLHPETAKYGHPNNETGRAMGLYITQAVRMAEHGELDAVVTAPINKKALQAAGFHYPGHTEMLADLTHTDQVVMMLAGTKLKVVPVTIHCALSDVPGLLYPEKILKTILVTDEYLKKYFSFSSPRIAVAGLNPHAGEEGLFGREETEIILPAIEQAQQKGVDATGPHPPDTLFYYASRGRFDAVVCMYHDQGLIPLKLLHFDDGVNITLGLPIIRTSVDHGTAYDIAGKGVADPQSLLSAIKMAVQIAKARS